MSNQTLIAELLDIEASAKVLMERCCKARKELERVNAPAPRKGKTKGMTAADRERLARFLAAREKRIGHGNKKAVRGN